MASDATGDWGQPNFLASGAPDLDGDGNDISNYFAVLAARQFSTQAALIAAGAPPADGYLARVTAIPGATFVRVSGAWVMYGTPRFTNATARDAAITTPASGMRSRLDSELWDREHDGTSWKLPRGPVLLQTKSFTTTTTGSMDAITGVTDFDYFEFIANITARSATAKLGLRLRASGADNTASSYDEYVATGATSTQWANLATASAIPCSIRGTLFDLGKASPTRVHAIQSGAAIADGAGINVTLLGGSHRASTAWDSFSIIPASGNWTGTVSVWGIRA